MLDRIRRKLFLSVKILGSDSSSSSESTSLGSSELLDILRKGSSALTQPDNGMNLETFLTSDISAILEASRTLESQRDAKMRKELKVEAENMDQNLLLDAEEEERRLLSGVAQVQSRLFEGKLVRRTQTNTEIADEWRNLEKRARIDRTVVIDGMSFIAPPAAVETVRSMQLFLEIWG